MFPIEIVRIGSIEIVHGGDEIAARGFYEKVVMIGHQHIRMDQNAIPLMHAPSKVQETLVVSFLLKNGSLFVTTSSNVVKGTFILDS